MPHILRHILPSRCNNVMGKALGDTRLVQHFVPFPEDADHRRVTKKRNRAAGRPDKKICRMLQRQKHQGETARVMPIRSKSFLVAAFALTIAAPFLGHAARADDFPSHPIHLIVPYAAGGSADATARVIAKQVSKRTGQAVVVENRGGSAAILGT